MPGSTRTLAELYGRTRWEGGGEPLFRVGGKQKFVLPNHKTAICQRSYRESLPNFTFLHSWGP